MGECACVCLRVQLPACLWGDCLCACACVCCSDGGNGRVGEGQRGWCVCQSKVSFRAYGCSDVGVGMSKVNQKPHHCEQGDSCQAAECAALLRHAGTLASILTLFGMLRPPSMIHSPSHKLLVLPHLAVRSYSGRASRRPTHLPCWKTSCGGTRRRTSSRSIVLIPMTLMPHR